MSMLTLSPLVNLRDLGGIPVTEGRVRPGALWRSDDVATIDEASAKGLADDGLATILDLRSLPETEITGRGPLDQTGVTYVHLPLTDNTSVPGLQLSALADEPTSVAEELMGGWYAHLLTSRADSIVSGFEAIANSTGATLFHCAAGKDRTGIFAASILSTLGAEPDAIVADYAQTDASMPLIIQRIRGSMPELADRATEANVPPVLMRAPARAMESMLEQVATQYGSVVELLERAGLSRELRSRLQERLVESA